MKIKKEILIGFILGLLTAVIGIAICIYIIANAKGTTFISTFYLFKNGGRFWMLLALGSTPILGTFFYLLKKDLEYKARGVVLATLMIAFIVFWMYL